MIEVVISKQSIYLRKVSDGSDKIFSGRAKVLNNKREII